MSIFRPKNRNQGIYWVRYYLDHVDKPRKQQKPSKQDEYRQTLLQMLNCFENDTYPEDIAAYIQEIHRLLELKRITSKHMDNINFTVNVLANKYKE